MCRVSCVQHAALDYRLRRQSCSLCRRHLIACKLRDGRRACVPPPAASAESLPLLAQCEMRQLTPRNCAADNSIEKCAILERHPNCSRSSSDIRTLTRDSLAVHVKQHLHYRKRRYRGEIHNDTYSIINSLSRILYSIAEKLCTFRNNNQIDATVFLTRTRFFQIITIYIYSYLDKIDHNVLRDESKSS